MREAVKDGGGIVRGVAVLDALRSVPGAEGMLQHVEVLEVAPSTNELALADDREGLLVVALEQTGGRGRHASSWSSPRGGLYLSYVPPVRSLPERPTDVSVLAALAVAISIDSVLAVPMGKGRRTLIKWPNDVLVGEGKVAGLLVQSATDGPGGGGASPRTVVGVGINVNTKVMLPPPGDLPPEEWPIEPRSLKQVAGAPVGLEPLLVEVMANLVRGIAGGLDDGSLAEYRSRCVTLGKRVTFTDGAGRREGTALDISPEGGALLVRLEDGGVREVRSGDVRHLRSTLG